MPQVRVDTVRQDYFIPFAGDGFSLVPGLTASDFASTLTVNGADVATTLSDDDEVAPTAGQVKLKEIDSTGRYSAKFLCDTVGSVMLSMEYTAGVLRFKEQYDVVQEPTVDVSATEKVALKVRDGSGGGVAHASFDVKTSSGARVQTGVVDGSGNTDLFLPTGTNYKIQVRRQDLQFTETTFNVVAGANPDLTITGNLGSLNSSVSGAGTKLTDTALKITFTHAVTAVPTSPDSVDKVEILDLDGSTVLETVASGSITKDSEGVHSLTAAGANLDAAGLYYAKVYFTVDSGGSQSTAILDFIVSAAGAGGLDADDLCTVSGTFTGATGAVAANIVVTVRYKSAIKVDGRLVIGAGKQGKTDKDGKLSMALAKAAVVQVEIFRLGIDKTVTVPSTATADWADLLV